MNNFNIIDCTLRDGGYYNNWHFSENLIKKYIQQINLSPIKFVEIGFLTFPKNNRKGITANCSKRFFKNFDFPKNTNFGIMINASDLINYKNELEKKQIIQTLKSLNIKELSFVRIACHHSEVFKIKKYISILKKIKKLKLFINLMQISEIDEVKIKSICKYSLNKFECMYLADSLGSLNSKTTISIINKFNKYWPHELGIHAHDNLKLALNNSLIANKVGVKWIDSTFTGMGRGPGNTKTEDIIKYLKSSPNQNIKQIKKIKKLFEPLKKKYKWGTNKYYHFSGKYKIHPTYIQTMLNDERYNKADYLSAIKFLKNSSAKTYNPYNLLSAFNIYNFKKKFKKKKLSIEIKKNHFEEAIILGPGQLSIKLKKRLLEKIHKTKPLVICLNNSKPIEDKYIDIRAFCHPMRIFSNLSKFKNFKNKLLVPYSCLSKKIKSYFDEKKIIDFGIQINKDINIYENFIKLNNPLVIVYVIGFLVSLKIKNINLIGFDGYSKDEPNQDLTLEYLKELQKKYHFDVFNLNSLSSSKIKN